MTPDEIAALHAKLDNLADAFTSYKLECEKRFAKIDRQWWALIALLVGSGLLTASQIAGF